MSEQELMFSVLIGIITASVMVIILSFVQWYRVRSDEIITTRMRHLRGKRQPTVTVLVYVRNQAIYIERTLRSLRNNRYHAFDAVVVNDASEDNTSKIVKQFCVQFPDAPIQVLRRQKVTTMSQALRAGYRKSKKGSIVITITPDQLINEQFIKRTVAQQTTTGRWQVRLKRTFGGKVYLSDLGERLEQYLWHQESRARAYTSSVFLKKHTNPTAGIRNEVDTIGALSVLTALLCITVPIATFGTQALWYVWIIAVAYSITVVWMRFDEHPRDKSVVTFALPLAIFLVPITSIMRGIFQPSVRK